MEKQIICPKCKSTAVIKWCKRKTENRGIVQRYCCKACSKKFTIDDGFYRMRNNPQKITCAIDLFYRGVSTRKVQEHFQAFYPHNSSHKSIYKGIVKYSQMISQFTDSLKLKVGSEVQVDEVEYHRRKSHKAKLGTEQNWFIDSIDTKTRFMVASNYIESRNQKDIKKIMNSIKDRAENQLTTLTTDGLLQYESVVKSVFKYNNKLGKYNIIYNRVNASKGQGFNYPIERLHNSVRARTKVFRGFHGSVDSARSIMKGYEIYYNFITKHQALNCCPYELAIPELKGKLDINKWLDLINFASSKSYSEKSTEVI